MEPIIAREVAEDEFNRFCDDMDIDRDTSKMDEDDTKGFNSQKENIIAAIMDGRLIINEESEAVFSPKRGKFDNPLIFREPTGATYMAMDRKKSGQDVGKMLALMDDLTKSAPGTCSRLKNVDFKVAQSIIMLFLV